jgi:hypothetical protein
MNNDWGRHAEAEPYAYVSARFHRSGGEAQQAN